MLGLGSGSNYADWRLCSNTHFNTIYLQTYLSLLSLALWYWATAASAVTYFGSEFKYSRLQSMWLSQDCMIWLCNPKGWINKQWQSGTHSTLSWNQERDPEELFLDLNGQHYETGTQHHPERKKQTANYGIMIGHKTSRNGWLHRWKEHQPLKYKNKAASCLEKQ